MRRAAGFVLALSSTLAAAAAAADRQIVDVPAGRLGEAIVALSRLSGASVRLADPSLWTRPVSAVHGRMTIRGALRKLDAGPDLRIEQVGPNSWLVSRAPHAVRAKARVPAPPPASDIVVTGSKRATPLSGYAGMVTVLSGADLESSGPIGSSGLEDRLPSVTSTHLGDGRDKLFIRGIADSGLVGQSQATVGQYLGDLRLTYSAPDPDLRLYDLKAVEVLEGPQGTLYGAGSPGGIVRLVRNQPVLDRFEGSFAAGLSTTAHGANGGDGAAVVNLPVMADRAALRIVGYADTAGGYIDTLSGARNVNRVDTAGGRVLLRLVPATGWTVDVGGVVQRIHGHDAQYADQDLPKLMRRSPLAQPYSDFYRMAEATVSKTWDDDIHFVSSNATTWQDVVERYDVTIDPAVPRLLRRNNRTRMIASENRLSKPMRNGLGWVVGASILHNSSLLTRTSGQSFEAIPDTTLPPVGVRNRLDEQTGYGELSVEPLRNLILTGGARVTHQRLFGGTTGAEPVPGEIGVAVVPDRRSETLVLPSVSIAARAGRGWLLYSRYGEGFRPGGLGAGDGFYRRFDSDRIATTEWGVRYTEPRSGTISLAASIAFTRWKNIQADFLDASGLAVTTNIGNGRIWTFDGELSLQPSPSLRAGLSMIVNDGRLTRPDEANLMFVRGAGALAEGGNLPNVSALGARASLNWHRRVSDGVDLGLGGWVRYVGRARLGIGPTLGRRQGDYVDSAVSARLAWSRRAITLSVHNLFDISGNRFALGTPLHIAGSREITPLVPRTVRLGFETNF